MALQPLDRSAPNSAMPEALARFAPGARTPSANPLRLMSWVALAVDSLTISASVGVGFLLHGDGGYPWRTAIGILVAWIALLARSRR